MTGEMPHHQAREESGSTRRARCLSRALERVRRRLRASYENPPERVEPTEKTMETDEVETMSTTHHPHPTPSPAAISPAQTPPTDETPPPAEKIDQGDTTKLRLRARHNIFVKVAFWDSRMDGSVLELRKHRHLPRKCQWIRKGKREKKANGHGVGKPSPLSREVIFHDDEFDIFEDQV